MSSVRKNFPALTGWLACLAFTYFLSYLLGSAVNLLRKSFPFEPKPIVAIVLIIGIVIIATYIGFLLSIRWVVFPLAAFVKIATIKPQRWHLLSEWFSFNVTVIFFSLPLIALYSFRYIFPISATVMKLISYGWQTLVSLFIYRDIVISDLYLNDAVNQANQKDLDHPTLDTPQTSA